MSSEGEILTANIPPDASGLSAGTAASGSSLLRQGLADSDIAVAFSHVNKTYRLFKNDRARFLSAFSKRVPHETVKANNDLSFTVRRGESVAFLGNNGAGKTTVLKMITGVTAPTSGCVEVNGRVSALLELSAGFDMLLTGRENVEMRGYLWGLSKDEIEQLVPRVIEFAEIGTYIDQPMRTYSSGMKARLGFAFSSSITPDILVVDEALSVGDRRFSKKCQERIHEIVSDSHVTVLFVTHALQSAKSFCSRGIVLESGRKTFDGPIAEALAFYESTDDSGKSGVR